MKYILIDKNWKKCKWKWVSSGLFVVGDPLPSQTPWDFIGLSGLQLILPFSCMADKWPLHNRPRFSRSHVSLLLASYSKPHRTKICWCHQLKISVSIWLFSLFTARSNSCGCERDVITSAHGTSTSSYILELAPFDMSHGVSFFSSRPELLLNKLLEHPHGAVEGRILGPLESSSSSSNSDPMLLSSILLWCSSFLYLKHMLLGL